MTNMVVDKRADHAKPLLIYSIVRPNEYAACSPDIISKNLYNQNWAPSTVKPVNFTYKTEFLKTLSKPDTCKCQPFALIVDGKSIDC